MKSRTIRAKVLLQVHGSIELINAFPVEKHTYATNVTASDTTNILLQMAIANIKGFRGNIETSWLTAVAEDCSRLQIEGSDLIPLFAEEIELTCVMGKDFKFDAHKPLSEGPQEKLTSSTPDEGAKKNPDKQYSPTLLPAAIYLAIGSVGLQLAFVTSQSMALKLGETALFVFCACTAFAQKNPIPLAPRHMPEITCALAYLFLSVAASSYLPNDLISDSTRKAIYIGTDFVQAASCAVYLYSVYKQTFGGQAVS